MATIICICGKDHVHMDHFFYFTSTFTSDESIRKQQAVATPQCFMNEVSEEIKDIFFNLRPLNDEICYFCRKYSKNAYVVAEMKMITYMLTNIKQIHICNHCFEQRAGNNFFPTPPKW